MYYNELAVLTHKLSSLEHIIIKSHVILTTLTYAFVYSYYNVMYLLHAYTMTGILNAHSSAPASSDAQATSAPNRKSIIVEDDMLATENSSRGSGGGGGGCCGGGGGN